MSYLINEDVTPKTIPVSDPVKECNKHNDLWTRRSQMKNNCSYSSTDTRDEYSASASEDCVEFNYADVASENELNETAEDFSLCQSYDESIDESNHLVQSVAYFNSLKQIPEETSFKSPPTKRQRTRLLSSAVINQIDAHYNNQLQGYINESGNTALYKYMHPSAQYPLILPSYLPPSYLESSVRIDKSLGELAASPLFHKYQLLGDSQLLRFSEVVLSMRRWRMKGKRARIGYCVSGQSVAELGARIRGSECQLKTHVIVLIGTNDMRRNTDVFPIIQAYSDLVDQLERHCDRIVLLTVPPLPFMYDQNPKIHIDRLKIVNGFIKELDNKNNIIVVDFCSLFISFDNTVSEDYFEKFLREDKIDMIHMNKYGFKMLKTILDTQYFDKYKA